MGILYVIFTFSRNSDESSEACDSIENLSQTFNQLTTADEEIEPSPSSVSVRTLRDVTNTKVQANISADSPKRKNITVARGRRGRPRKKRNDAENNNSGTLSIEDIRHITRTERQLEASYRISIQEGKCMLK